MKIKTIIDILRLCDPEQEIIVFDKDRIPYSIKNIYADTKDNPPVYPFCNKGSHSYIEIEVLDNGEI